MPDDASTTRQKNSPSSLTLSASFQGPARSTTARGASQAKFGIMPPPSHDAIKKSSGAKSRQTASDVNTASLGSLANRAQAPDAIDAAGAALRHSTCRRILSASSLSSASRN